MVKLFFFVTGWMALWVVVEQQPPAAGPSVSLSPHPSESLLLEQQSTLTLEQQSAVAATTVTVALLATVDFAV